MKSTYRIELRDSSHNLLGEVSRCISQRSPSSPRYVEYKGKKYRLFGGIRTEYWITIND